MIYGIEPSLAEGGKIKIGGLGEARSKRGGGTFRLPQKHDHFTITKTSRNRQGDLEIDAAVMAALPKDSDGKCRELPVILHADSIDDVFPTTYAMYVGKKIACRGDGQTAVRWEVKDNRRTGRTKEVECPCEFLGGKGRNVCKPHGTLHCSLALPGLAVAGAVYKWRTTSIISIRRIIGSLQQILATCGVLRGLPLVLRLEPVEVQPDDAPASTVYCCHLELRAKDILSVQHQALQAAQMRRTLSNGDDIDAAYRRMIQAPALEESSAEQADIAAEFYPESDEPEVLRPGRQVFGRRKEHNNVRDQDEHRMDDLHSMDESGGEVAPGVQEDSTEEPEGSAGSGAADPEGADNGDVQESKAS